MGNVGKVFSKPPTLHVSKDDPDDTLYGSFGDAGELQYFIEKNWDMLFDESVHLSDEIPQCGINGSSATL